MRYALLFVTVFAAIVAAGCGRAEPVSRQIATPAAMTTSTALPTATPSGAPTSAAVPTNAPKETAMSQDATTRPPTTQSEATEQPAQPTPERPTEPAAPTPASLRATPLAPAPEPTAIGSAADARPIDPALAALVDGAKADLARRQSVAPERVEVVEARSVTWPNAGLGCPQPGMAYKQVPVDGLLIRLRVGGQIFNYHGGGGRAPFLCEQKLNDPPKVPPPGMDQ